MSSCAVIPEVHAGGSGGSGGGCEDTHAAAGAGGGRPLRVEEIIETTRARIAARGAPITTIYEAVRSGVSISRIPITCGCLACKNNKPMHCVIGLPAGGGGGPVTGPQTYYVNTLAEAERVIAGWRLVPLTDSMATTLMHAIAGSGATQAELDAAADKIDALYEVVDDRKAEAEAEESDDDAEEDEEDEEDLMQKCSDHIHTLWEEYESDYTDKSRECTLRSIINAYAADPYCSRLLLNKGSRLHVVERLSTIVSRSRFLDSIYSDAYSIPFSSLNRIAWQHFQARLEKIKSWPGYKA
jgi:hypothetical protein